MWQGRVSCSGPNQLHGRRKAGQEGQDPLEFGNFSKKRFFVSSGKNEYSPLLPLPYKII